MTRRPTETAEQVLERWLADVRAGKIIEVAIAGSCPGGGSTVTFSVGAGTQLAGGVAYLTARLGAYMIQESTDWPLGAQETPPCLAAASGDDLDWLGCRAGIERIPGEADYAYRSRLMAGAA